MATRQKILQAQPLEPYTLTDADLGKYLRVRVSFSDRRGFSETRVSRATSTPVGALPNRPATGAPTISRDQAMRQELIASVEGNVITDEDGLPADINGYNYQWRRNDTPDFSGGTPEDITDATNPTYTLTSADLGKYLRVRVSFADQRGFPEMLTSVSTAQINTIHNQPATGAPTISRGPVMPQQLLASVDGVITDADGLPADINDYRYQWQRNGSSDFTDTPEDITGETNASYTLTSADDGMYVRVVVSFTDGRGSEEALPSASIRINSPATGMPSISGIATGTNVLTAVTNTIADDDGLNTFNYQWQRSDDANFASPTNVGSNDAQYTLEDLDAGKYIRVIVSFTDMNNFPENFTAAPRLINSPATGTLSISGTASGTNVLTAVTNTIADDDVLGTFSYQWQRSDDANFASPTNVGSNDAQYTLEDLDAGKYIRVIVSFTDMNGFPESFTSAPRLINSPATGTLSISGVASGTNALTAVTNTIADDDELDTFSYQWQRSDDINFVSSTNVGSNDAQYTLEDLDAGKYIRVIVSFTDMNGFPEAFTAAPRLINTPATGTPSISGTASGTNVLTAVTNTIADDDVLGTFSYQWQRSDDINFVSPTNVGSNDAQYTLEDLDAGKYIRVIVSFTDMNNFPESFTATPRLINSPATGAPSISGTASGTNVLTAVTNTIADDDGLDTFSYQWQRSDDANFVSPTNVGSNNAQYTLEDLDAGKYIRVIVSFTDMNGFSESFTAAPRLINSPATGTLSISGTASGTNALTAVTNDIADDDVLDTFSYQWQRSDDTNFVSPTNVGSNNAQYTLEDLDAGKYIRVIVSFTDMNGFSESFTAAPRLINSPATGTLSISGIATVPNALTAVTNDIADDDVLDTFNYQWQRSDDTNFVSPTNVGSNDAQYTLEDLDAGKYIRVIVSFTDMNGFPESFTATTAQIAARGNTPATGTLTISGIASGTNVLTAVTNTIADDDGLNTFSYQWQRSDDANFANPTNVGSNNAQYTLEGLDAGKYIRVIVSFTDMNGFPESFTAAPRLINSPATGTLSISGIATVPNALTAVTNDIADDDVLDTFNYQWQRSDDTNFVSPTNVGSNDAQYTLEDLDAGKYIRVIVSFTDMNGFPESFTATTAQIAARGNTPATGTLTISGIASGTNVLTAVTNTIADDDGLGTFSYQWQRSDDANFASPTNVGSNNAQYTLEDLDAGKYIRVIVSFTDMNNFPESFTANLADRIAITDLCGRTPQVRDAILGKITRVNDCALVTTMDLNGITGRLSLSNSGLTSLTPGDFADLMNVEMLVVAGVPLGATENNRLTTLPAGVFAGLSAVTELSIRKAMLATLSVDKDAGLTSFSGLESLTMLRLERNNITNADLPEDVFMPLAKTLTTLALQDNGLTAFPTDALRGLPSLSTLNVEKNPDEGSPAFAIPYELVRTDGGTATLATIEVRLPTYVPSTLRGMKATLSIEEGSGTGTLTVGSGAPTTASITVALNTPVTVTATGNSAVVVSATAPATQDPDGVNGMVIGNAEALTLNLNAPPTGAPAITRANTDTGMPAAGQTLMATQGTLDDPNGGTSPVVVTAYEWQRSATETFDSRTSISGANSNAYLLDSADVGSYVRVVVSFTDGANNPEVVASEPFGVPRTDLCGRTEEIQTALIRRIGADNCVVVTTAQLMAISGTLDLSNAGLESLRAGDFANLGGVEILAIDEGNERLMRLPADVFSGLSSVTRLGITKTGLTTIESGAFNGLTVLKSLVLRENSIAVLPEDVFAGLTNLDTLNLGTQQHLHTGC